MTVIDPTAVPDHLEQGALAARSGLGFQDEVALLCCLEMCLDASQQEVRCESLDDVARVCSHHIEYIQVKDLSLEQLWSVAKLTERDGGSAGTSLLEKSLARALQGYRSHFTVVTSLGVKSELKPLTYSLEAELRSQSDVAELAVTVSQRLPDASRAPDGSTVAEWVERAHWRVEGNRNGVRLSVNRELRRVAEFMGYELTLGDLDRVHDSLLRQVRSAADSPVPSEKRFTRDDFATRVHNEIEHAQGGQLSGYAARTREKMQAAEIDETAVETAVDMRRAYRQELLTPRYSDAGSLSRVASDVQARVAHLRARRQVDVSGQEFHRLCMDNVAEVANAYADVPLKLALGSLYDLTNRCLHRFD